MESLVLQGGEGLEEAVKERCLQDLRDRLALRANLLQDKLDQVSANEPVSAVHLSLLKECLVMLSPIKSPCTEPFLNQY